MSVPGYIDRIYKTMMKDYNTDGENLMYGECKIYDMNNNQIKKFLYSVDNGVYFNPCAKGWKEIFNDVLTKRRFNKLKKIKSNIV